MLSRTLKAQFAVAMRRFLRPVVKQMIAYGMTYPAFSQLTKELYIDVAEQEFALPFKRQTDSRLGLVTGIPRKEIPKLRRKRAGSGPTEVEDTVVTHVIGRWMAGPPYASPDGTARRLEYESSDPSRPSFAGLVRGLGVDTPVRAVLDELLRVGSVTLRGDGSVDLRQEAHILPADAEGKLTLLATDPGELFSTIIHNIEHPENPWLQRKVVYDNVGADALALLEAEARRAGEDFIRRANALLSSYDRDRSPDAPAGDRHRVVLGVYYFDETTDDSARREKDPPPGSPPPGRIRRNK